MGGVLEVLYKMFQNGPSLDRRGVFYHNNNQTRPVTGTVAKAVMALTMCVFCHGLFSGSQVEDLGDLTRKAI